jgi:hypothetical protein
MDPDASMHAWRRYGNAAASFISLRGIHGTRTPGKDPATYMRGGTSKGVFFRLQDLPSAARCRARRATSCCCA